MKKTTTLMAMLPALCQAAVPTSEVFSRDGEAQETNNGFKLLHDLTTISIKDSRDRDWDGGCYTQEPVVKVSYECVNPDIISIRMSVQRCNGIVRADGTYSYLESVVERNSPDIDITNIVCGETTEFDVSVPGRYYLAYCAIGKDDSTVLTGGIGFDSLYDDGNWIACGDAEVSSGVLSSENQTAHVFYSNGTGLMEEPGDIIWWVCPLTYPYYSGEAWTAPMEYNPILRMYRIVDPFTRNADFKDYFPEDYELLSAYYDNVAYTPEAFIFDRENPAWFLINAKSEYNAYCEPMRTGIVANHMENPYCYIAHPYNQVIGYVRYDVCPTQNIKNLGVYVDMPMADESEASIIVRFPGWTTGVDNIRDDKECVEEYYTIDGMKVSSPGKGFYIIRQGSKSSKIIY